MNTAPESLTQSQAFLLDVLNLTRAAQAAAIHGHHASALARTRLLQDLRHAADAVDAWLDTDNPSDYAGDRS